MYIIISSERLKKMKKVTKAVIPAAGLGTRMLPIARAVPKEALPIVDRPAISYLVEEAKRSGITDVLIITGRYYSSARQRLCGYEYIFSSSEADKGAWACGRLCQGVCGR